MHSLPRIVLALVWQLEVSNHLSINLLRSSDIKQIAVFRALQLGDMLCSVPAFRALRNAFPSAKITLLGLPWANSFTRRFYKYFDSFIHFPGYPGLPEQKFQPKQIINFFGEIQQANFDLVLQMQ